MFPVQHTCKLSYQSHTPSTPLPALSKWPHDTDTGYMPTRQTCVKICKDKSEIEDKLASLRWRPDTLCHDNLSQEKQRGRGQLWQGGRVLQFKADFVLRKCKFVFVLAVEKLFMAIKLCLGDNCAWLGLPKARPANLWLKAKVICRTPLLPPHCATVGSAVMTRVSSMSVLSISGTVPKSMGKWNFQCLFLFLFSRLPFRVHFVLLHSSLCFFSSNFQFCLSAVCFVITYSNKINDYEAPSQRQETETAREWERKRESGGEEDSTVHVWQKFCSGSHRESSSQKAKNNLSIAKSSFTFLFNLLMLIYCDWSLA